MRYTEELGQTVANKLVRRDPDPLHCGREKCFPCQNKAGKCQKPGIIYHMECQECLEGGKKSIYIGESAHCGFDRGQEHIKAMESEDQESPLVEHRDTEHPGREIRFKMIVKEFPRTTMMRQCLEAHHIETLGKTCAILNRRGEWGQNLPPKLVLEGDNIPEIGKNRKRARKKEGNQ